MKNLFRNTVLSVAVLLAGCQGENGTAQPLSVMPESDAVAIVNGKSISKETLELFTSEVAKQTKGAEVPKEKIVEELINRELLSQEAEREKLDRQPDIANRLAFIKRSFLFQAAVQNYLKSVDITDDQIKAEYDRRVSGMNNIEYKARHILVKSEDSATDIIRQLKNSGKFETLAKAHSTGPTGPNGGDLGWFKPQSMAPKFSEAVMKLEKGKYSETPVQTQFGWHVILREDSRESPPPPLDKVKENVIGLLKSQKLKAHISDLKKNAEIVVSEEKN